MFCSLLECLRFSCDLEQPRHILIKNLIHLFKFAVELKEDEG